MNKLLIVCILILACSKLSGQAPQAFKYQAVVRDTSGNVIQDQLVSLKISILNGSVDGEVVYSEIHDITTNGLGLVNLEIGRGLVTSGSFNGITWGDNSYFIRTELDITGGMNYILMGISQLLAVPYALYAETAGNQVNPLVDSTWETTDEGIYYDKGYVGIGTANPEVPLQIEGQSESQDGRTFLKLYNHSTDAFSYAGIVLTAGNGSSNCGLSHLSETYSLFNNKYASTTILANQGKGLILRSEPGGRISFEFTKRDSREYSECMRITSEGKVGIGTTDPMVALQLEGESTGQDGRNLVWIKNRSTDEYSTAFMTISSGDDDSYLQIDHRGDSYTIYGDEWRKTSLLWNHGQGLLLRTSYPGNIYFEFYDGTVIHESARITGDGRVGIGTKDPQRNLHVKDVMRLEPRDSPPDGPSEGDIYMDGNDHKLKVFDGTTWQSCW